MEHFITTMKQNEINWYSGETTTFGDRLAGAREASGMTQRQLAKNLGVKLSTLKNWEHDVSEPRANKLSMLAGVLNVSVMWLLNGEGEGIKHPEDKEKVAYDISSIFFELREIKATLKLSLERLSALEQCFRDKLR